MQRRAWLGLLMLSSLALACEEGGGEDEGGDESGKNGGKKSGKKKSAAKSDDGSVPAPEPGQVPTLKVGSWSKYETETGTVTFGLVDKRNDTEYLVDGKVTGPMDIMIQAWLNVPDLRDAKGMKMLEARAKLSKGPIQDVKFGSNAPTSVMFEKIMDKIIQKRLEGLPQEDVKVAAGLFRKCYRWKNTQSLMGITSTETIWSHPVVPLPAMVKSEVAGGKGGMELIAYGSSGAKKSF